MAANKRNLLSLALGFITATVSFSQAPADRYMVFFKDKVGTPYSVANPEQFLSPKSISRRTKQSISIEEHDLPITPSNVTGVSSSGAKVIFRTKWMNGVLVEATSSQRNSIESLPFVSNVEFVAPGKTGSSGRTRSVNKFESTGYSQESQNQNALLALDEMHKDGITGSGVIIAVLDTGFPEVLTNPAFGKVVGSNRILDSHNFALASNNVFMGHPHGAQVFSIIGSSLSNYSGGAIGGTFLLYATEFTNSEFRVEEYNWLFAAERADSVGADIISSSLGYTEFDDQSMDYQQSNLDGKTAVVTKAANMAFDRGIVVVVSAGNLGNSSWRNVSAPADGKNVLAVGAVGRDLDHAFFSSYGPTADGRIKPDVVALGDGAAYVATNGVVFQGSGTSYACPMIASLVAGVMQTWPELTAAQIISLIRVAGSLSFNPNNTFGYGIPTYKAVKNIIDIPNSVSDNILVYPNPIINNELNIAILPTDGSPTRVRVFSIMGQFAKEVAYEAVWNLNPFHLDVSALVPGYYYVIVENKGVSKTFRIIKH